MRKKIIIIGVVIAVLTLSLYILDKTSVPRVTTIKNVSITIKKETLTNRSATVVITNKSNKTISFGEEYTIEKKLAGKWIKLETKEKEIWWNLVGHSIEPNKNYQEMIDWYWMYGRLSKGKYRLVKKINDKRVAVNFTID